MNSPRLQVAILVLVLVPALCAFSVRGETVIFVDGDASAEPHDGSTWCNAFVTLDEALDAASPGDIIRIAGGTYKPDPTGLPDPREATFQLVNAVRVEGGYAGCGAPDPDERDFDLHETILSGDLNGAVANAISDEVSLTFNDGTHVYRLNQGGSGIVEIIALNAAAVALGLDVSNQWVCWANETAIRRTNVDGTGTIDLLVLPNASIREFLVEDLGPSPRLDECSPFDINLDRDMDMFDSSRFQGCFTGCGVTKPGG